MRQQLEPGREPASSTHRGAVGRGAAGTCERLRRGSPGAGGRLGLPELQQKVCGEGEGTDESPRLPRAGAHAHPISHR